MEWSDTALVLALGRFRERDVWLSLLTRKHGVVRVFAFGGNRSRRRFPGCLDLLNRLDVRIETDRTGRFRNLAEGIVLRGPHRLRTDGVRLGMALNCLRFLEALDVPVDEAGGTFDVTCATLDVLEEADVVSECLPMLFRLRLASDQGYAPDFTRCATCGTDLVGECVRASWRADDGLVRCDSCASGDDRGVRLNPGMVAAMSAVVHGMPEDWHIDGLSAGDRRAFVRVVDELVEYHVGLTWEHGRFVRN